MIPNIRKFEEIQVDDSVCLMGAAGFEDRALAVFEEAQESNFENNIDEGIGVEYLPFDQRNDINGFTTGMESIGIGGDEINWITYDTREPDPFTPRFETLLEEITCDHVLLDISGMSKFLIILSLSVLAENDVKVTIFYAEADVYYPTKEKFEKEKSESPEEQPAFLTYGVYNIVSARKLSSMAKTGQPLVTIGFPTFNPQEMMALVSELPPHHFVSIEGVPRLNKDAWRLEAIRWLNRDLESYINVEYKRASTFDPNEIFERLNQIYDEYGDAYRLILAPTGSKLQTVGAALFRRLHSDIQVVYPVTEEFAESYTSGWKETWGIELDNIDETIGVSSSEKDGKILELRDKIKKINDGVSAD